MLPLKGYEVLGFGVKGIFEYFHVLSNAVCMPFFERALKANGRV